MYSICLIGEGCSLINNVIKLLMFFHTSETWNLLITLMNKTKKGFINWRRLLSQILYWRNYQRQRRGACCSKYIFRLGLEWEHVNFWFQKSFIYNFDADQYITSFKFKHWIRKWSLWKRIFRNFRTSHKNFLEQKW